LLRNIHARQVVEVGTVPLSIALEGEGKWIIEHSGSRTLPRIRIALPIAGIEKIEKVRFNRAVIGDVSTATGCLVCVVDIPAGKSELTISEE
jgi:hypothetical protein